MELLACEFEYFSSDEDEGIFSGHAATWGKVPFARGPRGGTFLQKGAFTQTLKQTKKPFKVLWNHRHDEVIGNTLSIAEDKKGLLFSAQLNLDIQRGRETFSNIKKKIIDEMSIGFETTKEEEDNEKETRTIKEVKLWEISPVAFPADPTAQITEAHSALPYQDLPLADRAKPWSAGAAKRRIKTWAGGDDVDVKKYSKAFVWVDSENKENLTAYKLPIADVIGGRLTAIPRGVFAAAGAVRGARDGVDIPSADMPRVRSHLGRYYKKMDLTPPWEQDNRSADFDYEIQEVLDRYGVTLSEPIDTLIQPVEFTTDSEPSIITATEPTVWKTIKEELLNLNTKLEAK
jgi:HK97 family phage prohead protease